MKEMQIERMKWICGIVRNFIGVVIAFVCIVIASTVFSMTQLETGDTQLIQGLTHRLVAHLFLLLILGLAFLIFHEIKKQNTPFFLSIVRKLKTIGILFAAMEIAARWSAYLVAWKLGAEVSFAVITEGTLIFIFMGLLFYSLSIMFEYGIVLQQQDDETL